METLNTGITVQTLPESHSWLSHYRTSQQMFPIPSLGQVRGLATKECLQFGKCPTAGLAMRPKMNYISP